MVVHVYRANEPDRGTLAAHFHTHERIPAYSDGTHDAQVGSQHADGDKATLLAMLDVAWDERNQFPVTCAGYDYWEGHIAVYREVLGLSPARDLARRTA